MMDPRAIAPGSLMPVYSWLKDGRVDFGRTAGKLAALRTLGVPYPDDVVLRAAELATGQAELIRADLAEQDVQIAADSEMIALIAYLQRLGRGEQYDTSSPRLTIGKEGE